MSKVCPNCLQTIPFDTKFCLSCNKLLHNLVCDGGGDPTKTARLELNSGQMLASRYKIIEELGTGGMGQVYKAFDTGTKETVAVKVLHPGIMHDEEALQRFCNELRLSRKISHRNVCRMFDLQTEDKTHFITMEYVDGEDLKTTLERTGPLSPHKVLDLGIQICKGLREGHRLGIIHRDLKSRNIMLDKKGHAHILDYGIARSLSESLELTRTGSLVGTPGYIAPEQMEGMVDYRADIFSFGVILYEAAAGFLPFYPQLDHQQQTVRQSGKPISLRKLNPQFPEKLEKIIFRCLQFHPRDRYQSADAVLNGLYAVEDHLPAKPAKISEKLPAAIEKSGTFRQMLPLLRTMKRKKIFETLAAFIGGGWLLLEFVHWILIDHYHLSEVILDITLISTIGTMIVTLIWRWHKAEPKHKTPIGALIAIALTAFFTILVNFAFIPRIIHPDEHSHSGDAIPVAPHIQTIALLTFKDQGGNSGYLHAGMTEDLISSLRDYQSFRVVPHRDTRSYSGYDDYNNLAKKLKSKFVVNPKFLKKEDSIHVKCDVYDSRKHTIEILEFIDDSDMIPEIPNRLAQGIAERLGSSSAQKTMPQPSGNVNRNSEAYDNFCNGWQQEINYREQKKEVYFKQSNDCYHKAITLDPDYGKAYWGLGNLYEARWVETDAEADFNTMVSYYQTAIEKNRSLAEAWTGMGWAYFYREMWDDARDHFQEALKIDPYSSDVHYQIGSFLRSAGLIKRAIKFYNQTISLNNMHIRAYIALAVCYWYLGQYKRSIRGIEPALAFYPQDHRIHLYLALNLIGLGKYSEARTALSDAEKNGADLTTIAYLNALLFAGETNKTKAQSMLTTLDPEKHTFFRTCVAALLRETETVSENIDAERRASLKEIKEYKFAYLILKNNFVFKPLHSNQEFKDLLELQKIQYMIIKKKLRGL